MFFIHLLDIIYVYFFGDAVGCMVWYRAKVCAVAACLYALLWRLHTCDKRTI